MAKSATLLLVALLLCFTLCSSARPEPAFNAKVQPKHEVKGDEDGCNGIGEEECLMRRSLVAHLDYIYTQKQKP